MQAISNQQTVRTAQIIRLERTIGQKKSTALIIKSKRRWDVVPFDDICYCEAKGNYCFVYTIKGQKVMASKSLKVIQKELPDKGFVRVHQSYVVAVSAIRCVELLNVITLADGMKIPLSRRKRATVLASLEAM